MAFINAQINTISADTTISKGGKNIMKKSNLFKQAHTIAKAFTEGNNKAGVKTSYSANLKMAFDVIKQGDFASIDTLVSSEFLAEFGYKKSVKRVEKPMQCIDTTEATEEKISFDASMMPKNIATLFPEELETLVTIIEKNLVYANRKQGEHLEVERMNFEDGLSALANVETFQELQAIMLTYFMQGMAKYMIYKHLEFGAGYKKLNKLDDAETQAKNGYQQASSNNGKITTHEIDDVFNQLVIEAYTKTFDENMFKNYRFVNPALFFRISNVLRTELRRLKKQTKVSIDDAMLFIEDTVSVSTEDEALKQAENLGIFNAEELEIIELRIAGYKKNEIDKKLGQRTDRKFKKIEKKFAEMA